MKKQIAIFDEEEFIKPIAENLERRLEVSTQFIDPNNPLSDRFLSNKYDLLIVEPYFMIEFPNIDITRKMNEFLSEARRSNIPTIFLSSMSEESVNEYGMRRGDFYDTFLQKPENLNKIVESVDKLLNLH